jgi:hypothetical protein
MNSFTPLPTVLLIFALILIVTTPNKLKVKTSAEKELWKRKIAGFITIFLIATPLGIDDVCSYLTASITHEHYSIIFLWITIILIPTNLLFCLSKLADKERRN